MNNILQYIKRYRLFGLLFFYVFVFENSFSQVTEEKEDKFEKIKDLFTFYPNKKKAAEDSTLYESKFIATPVVTFSPETNLAVGIGAKYLFKFNGSGEETRTSNIPLSLRYTLNNQFIFYSGFEMFTNQEKWVIEGNAIFQNFPRLYYGIGRDTPEENEVIYDSFQALLEPIFLKQAFTRYLFLGGGLRVNHIFNVETEIDQSIETNLPVGFNGSTSMGAEFAILYDSRNNILNAKNGVYLEFTHGFYGKVLGGTHEFQLTRFDLRYFTAIKKNPNNIIAFHTVGHFSHGNTPLSELALLGGKEIMRGYREGRYTDRNFLAAQTEFRKHFKNTRFGMVVFTGIGDVSDKVSNFQLKNVRPNFGVGLRFLLDRSEDLNMRFDWGFGDSSNNFYLNLSEAF